MSWIRVIPRSEAAGRLKTLYNRVSSSTGDIDNIMQVHSLRPHSMEGHLALYKYVLHHAGNTIPKWLLECLGVYVSLLNGCDYCVEHHYAGLRRLLGDDERSTAIRDALEAGRPEQVLGDSEVALARYAETLTLSPGSVSEDDVVALREAGYDDGEILEANQVISYFAYANRTALGLGVTTDGDILGLSPSSDEADDWSHR